MKSQTKSLIIYKKYIFERKLKKLVEAVSHHAKAAVQHKFTNKKAELTSKKKYIFF